MWTEADWIFRSFFTTLFLSLYCVCLRCGKWRRKLCCLRREGKGLKEKEKNFFRLNSIAAASTYKLDICIETTFPFLLCSCQHAHSYILVKLLLESFQAFVLSFGFFRLLLLILDLDFWYHHHHIEKIEKISTRSREKGSRGNLLGFTISSCTSQASSYRKRENGSQFTISITIKLSIQLLAAVMHKYFHCQ